MDVLASKSDGFQVVALLYMIIEEVIRGDRRDLSNPFQWESLMLNLPGSVGYKPTLPWIMQLRADN